MFKRRVQFKKIHNRANKAIDNFNILNGDEIDILIDDKKLGIECDGIIWHSEMFGKNSVKLATEYKPDLILLDLDLPDIHGNIVLIQLKANPKTRNIPVVVISADALPKQIEQMLQAGAMDYLTKPFDVDEFIKMLENGIKFHT